MNIIKIIQIIMVSSMLIVGNFNFCLGASAGIGEAFGEPLSEVATKAGYGTEATKSDVNVLIGKIITIAITFVGVIFLILLIYGGFIWMTARGDEAKVTNAQNILTAATIGLVIIVLAYVASIFVISKLAATTLK